MKIRFFDLKEKHAVHVERDINIFIADKNVIDIEKFDDGLIIVKYEDVVYKDKGRQGIFIPNEMAEGKYIYLINGKIESMGSL